MLSNLCKVPEPNNWNLILANRVHCRNPNEETGTKYDHVVSVKTVKQSRQS